MSEWFYVRLALGLTWTAIAGYALLVNRRRAAAARALNEIQGGSQ